MPEQDIPNPKPILATPSAEDQRPINEILELRQTLNFKNDEIDRLSNTLALFKEPIQQLRDEIASLKGQKPKPKISPSQLESPGQKQNWHKRFKPISEKRTHQKKEELLRVLVREAWGRGKELWLRKRSAIVFSFDGS